MLKSHYLSEASIDSDSRWMLTHSGKNKFLTNAAIEALMPGNMRRESISYLPRVERRCRLPSESYGELTLLELKIER